MYVSGSIVVFPVGFMVSLCEKWYKCAMVWEHLNARLRSAAVSPARFRPNAPYLAGVETRVPQDRYLWDGKKRQSDPANPTIVFQVTLSGWGIYESHGNKEELPVGRAFAAIVPSLHRYYLPQESPTWSFFWLVIRHPYVVSRMIEGQRRGVGAVLGVEAHSPVVQRTAELCAEAFADPFEEELALFSFLIAYERHIHEVTANRPTGPGEQLLSDTRRFVVERLALPSGVEELAAAYGMSRTRFSHRFREMTGEAPANFMAQVRLEEVARRLATTDATLDTIAQETGFADANHLCKAFRRHYQVSPGIYRRQIR